MRNKKYYKLAVFGMVIALGLQGCSDRKMADRGSNDIVAGTKEEAGSDIENNHDKSEAKETTSAEKERQDEPSMKTGNMENDSDFYAGADLQGSVVSYSDNGFVLSPAVNHDTGDGGVEMIQDAPGSEDEANYVNIVYSENLEIETRTVSKTSLGELSREAAEKDVIKKQTEVCVFGDCKDSHHWTANKILILRWQ